MESLAHLYFCFVCTCLTEQSVAIANMFSLANELHLGVPLGSVLVLFLLIIYTQPLYIPIKQHSLSCNSFTDDNQVQIIVICQKIYAAISSLETCMSDIINLMIENPFWISSIMDGNVFLLKE